MVTKKTSGTRTKKVARRIVKKTSRRKKYQTPPHTNEAKKIPLHKGRKPLIIGIITLALLLLFSFFALFGNQFVGRAFFTGQDNTAGLAGNPQVEIGRDTMYEVKANIGALKTSSFEITAVFNPTFLTCAEPRDAAGWNADLDVFREFTCENGVLTLRRGNLDIFNTPTGEVTFALVPIQGVQVGEQVVDFTRFIIINQETEEEIVLNVEDATLTIVPAGEVALAEEESVPGKKGRAGRLITQPDWSCQEWSYCNKTLQQNRICTDRKGMNPQKTEIQSCPECIQSWICGSWSSCQNGKQTRTCNDAHACGVATLQPELERFCSQPSPAVQQRAEPQQQVAQPRQPAPAPLTKSVWAQYKAHFIASGASLLVIVAVTILIVHHFHAGRKVMYNYDELKQWIEKERQMGTADDDIREILAEHTGWSEDDVAEVFKELDGEAPKQPPQMPPALPDASVPEQSS